MNTYTIGETARLSITLYNGPDNTYAPIDPTALTLRVTDAAGTETDYTWPAGTVVRDAVGAFHCDVAITNAPGFWNYRWKATGTAIAAHEGQFLVNASPFSNP